ncbi:MAG TPA: hypothetical protein VIM34_20815, partial [Burkholderiaceae bacterium]
RCARRLGLRCGAIAGFLELEGDHGVSRVRAAIGAWATGQQAGVRWWALAVIENRGRPTTVCVNQRHHAIVASWQVDQA